MMAGVVALVLVVWLILSLFAIGLLIFAASDDAGSRN